MTLEPTRETFHTIVIGGGQAGLSVGYFLARQHRRFVILDAGQRVATHGGSDGTRYGFSRRLFSMASQG